MIKHLLEVAGLAAVIVGIGTISVAGALIVGGLAVVVACEVRA